MANNSIKSNTCFWAEISEYKIQVPCYQRDYAQGRVDGGRIDNIRKVFVEELYRAIVDKKECHLGLVFGSYDEDNKTFIVVDGQQRLTTAFLLHWYLAWRENKLSEYKVLSTNFSWDTRSYSSHFVKLLFNINKTDNVNIIKDIKTNVNYFSIWEQDPTVKGMLTMLAEIESQYSQYGLYDRQLCQSLFSSDCKIKYDVLKLNKDSDEKTYLKMNSRGRSLTTYELFKSKFIDKHNPSFAKKFDEEWLNFILKLSKDKNGNFDDPDVFYMNFINEYTYCVLQLKDNENTESHKDFIMAKLKGNLADIPFISFEKYTDAFENIDDFEKRFTWIVENYDKLKITNERIGFPKSDFFLDEIIKSNNPNFSHRAKLFALFKYAELTDFKNLDETLYSHWNRVFRNLIANTDVDGSNIGNIYKAIEKIDNNNIYSYLSNNGELETFYRAQVEEEIAKVKQILNGTKRQDGKSWEEIIIDAEKYAFFNGAIRFLFQGENGDVNWDDFDIKWENEKKYFKEKLEPKQPKQLIMNDGYNNSILLKALISRFTTKNFEDVLYYSHRVFNNYSSTWRYYLLNDNIHKPVHEIMMGNISIVTLVPSPEEAENRLYQLSNTKLLDFVIENIPDSWIRDYHYHKAIFPSSTGIFLNADTRDNLLINTKEIKGYDNQVVPNTTFLYGSDINFTYNDQIFQWYRTDYVYLMVSINPDEYRCHDKSKTEETEKYFCFKVEDNMTPDAFIEKLNDLIRQAEEDKKAANNDGGSTDSGQSQQPQS